VSLEVSGAEAARGYIEAARPEHPSLVDTEHRMDALFGVVNIPNVIWIDEAGMIVRPPEPGWPPRVEGPDRMAELQEQLGRLPKMGRARTAPAPPPAGTPLGNVIGSGQDRDAYPDAIRDWVARGPASPFVLTPAEVVARSQPRDLGVSAAAAHFELANHLWRSGDRQGAIEHFNESHRLQPGNWTYKRQAWSLMGHERVGGPASRFFQGPVEGEEDDWPFISDFLSDVSVLGEGEYYPRTM
jgi:hypothetical protein